MGTDQTTFAVVTYEQADTWVVYVPAVGATRVPSRTDVEAAAVRLIVRELDEHVSNVWIAVTELSEAAGEEVIRRSA